MACQKRFANEMAAALVSHESHHYAYGNTCLSIPSLKPCDDLSLKNLFTMFDFLSNDTTYLNGCGFKMLEVN